MFNKFIATVVTGSICLSAMSAFAVNNRVRAVANCQVYNNNLRPLGVTLRANNFYPLVRFGTFPNRQPGVAILMYSQRTRRNYVVHVSSGCMESNRGGVVIY
ncbi:hypothetical protein DSM106972_065520 [Dulcicalothrix desertica PCC 7102]|uniref:Secreted protein n=1 Tax=Dulcicalothrix desertica PCC 7102 TaxID=232991 RepID=A0A3S1CH65_9CYAN|nr:hypothetical protein [Dulcicalothrix desertica]RUT01455.1 hypothetical protein DSM106972_065520 [Dulcicalothrix desertica PCC 7102]TWH43508.1 hypothetical protein CAL7102_07237 [Dulcicalothrix desertica PCC 7102]